MIKILANVNAPEDDLDAKGISFFDISKNTREAIPHIITQYKGENRTPMFSKVIELPEYETSLVSFLTIDGLFYFDIKEAINKRKPFDVNKLSSLEKISLDEIIDKLDLPSSDPLYKLVKGKETNIGGSLAIAENNLYWGIHRRKGNYNEGIKMICFDNFTETLELSKPRSLDLLPTANLKTLDNKIVVSCGKSINIGNHRLDLKSSITSLDVHDEIIAVADSFANCYIFENKELIFEDQFSDYARKVAIAKTNDLYYIFYGQDEGYVKVQILDLNKDELSEIKFNLFDSIEEHLIKNNEPSDQLFEINENDRVVKNINISPDNRIFFTLKNFTTYSHLDDIKDDIIGIRKYFLAEHRIESSSLYYRES